ncbi:MAG: 2-dehydropantoate 2-reductase [Eubacteriales bacterium]|nr:2-dehydropantoate 2-reductase [Eubacteriales bacterium]
MLKDKKIAVIGIGGVGGYIAGMLTRTFSNVTLCARGKRGESIRENGLILHSEFNGESVTKPVRVVESADQIGPQDMIFVCVKNYSLEEVGKLLSGVVTKDTIIVPIMNGVDPGDTLRKCLPGATVIDSLIYIVAYAKGDYSVVQEGNFADVKFGINHATEEEWAKVEEVSKVFTAAGISHETSRDVEAEIWKKYILNCAYNVLTAVYNNTIGELRDDPIKAGEIVSLINEAYEVAVAKGVHVDRGHADAIIHRLLHVLDGSGTSSLQRDIWAGKTAEIDTFGGYLVHEAEKLGINVPVSKRMYQRLLELSN